MNNSFLILVSYLLILFLCMYIIVYIPNKRKHKKMQEIHRTMKEGDEVVTIGGLVGKIVKKEGEYVFIEIDREKKINVKVIIYAINQVIKHNLE